MRPDTTLRTARLATIFYGLVAFAAVVYAFLFGHLDRLLGERTPTPEAMTRGLALGLAIVLATNIALRLSKSVKTATDMMGRFLGPIGIVPAIYLAVLSGFGEELFFRGALWPHFGLYGTSILFGILHTIPVRELALYPIFAALVGLIFGLLRQESGSIWPPVIAHTAINAINLAIIGARQRRRLEHAPSLPIPTEEEPEEPPLHLPDDIDPIEQGFPMTIWRYDLRVELEGTDRESLPQCLEHENLALFGVVKREEVYAQLADGRFIFAHSFAGPFGAFPQDVAAISAYLFQTVIGIEVAERYTEAGVTDDVRAWKTVAQRGEWVKVPLVVEEVGDGTFRIDQEADDLEVLAAHWNEYPRWFQDGMRFRYPRLREL